MSHSRKKTRAVLLALVVCALGALSAPAAQAFVMDTYFTQAPPPVSPDDTPTFRFSATHPPTGETPWYVCSVDFWVYSPCTQTWTPPLAAGHHTIRVAASGGGFSDPTPAGLKFIITPRTTFQYTPPSLTQNNRPLFIYRANGPDMRFYCRVDWGTSFACGRGNDSLFQTWPLSNGRHSFTVFAADHDGHGGPNVSWYFKVDAR